MLTELTLSRHIPPADKNFLSCHYTLSNSADWQLDFSENNYQLFHKKRSLKLSIDFNTGHYRHRNNYPSKEPLLRAVKIKQKYPSHIIDTTPGLLKDSLMLAGRGIKVTAFERNPLIYVMVNHALKQYTSMITYHFGEAQRLLPTHIAELIYLDPMYPPAKKTAQIKQAMQVLHHIVGSDADAAELLHCALQQARLTKARVVVKRPKHADSLANIIPSYHSQTATTRFDIYLPDQF